MAQYIQSHKYITIHHTVTAPAQTREDLAPIAKSIENYHKNKSYAETYKTGGEFGYSYISYHYLFAQDGSYIQLHDTKYQRIHATDHVRGTTSHNKHGIAIAVAGNMSTTRPSSALILGIAKLCAKLEKEYEVSFAIRGHKETAVYVSGSTVYYPEKTGVYYTECAGNFMGTSKSGVIRTIIDKTNDLLEGKPWYETLTKKEMTLTNDEMAHLYNIDTKEKIKTYMPKSTVGTGYVLGDYYLTQYSVTNKTKYGFKKSEWKEYQEPVPIPPEEDEVESLKQQIEILNKEVTRLKKEKKAAEDSYAAAVDASEEKDKEIEEINFKNKELRDKVKTLEVVIIDRDTMIKRLESDVLWCDDQIELKKEEIEGLKKSLDTCASRKIKEMSWEEIISGVFSKLTGREPE